MELLQKIAKAFLQIKAATPLIHHLTNFVTVNDCANITLAIGASPVMANDVAEVEEVTTCASAVVLNIGALNGSTATAMLAAGKKANSLGIPVVFDPVGVGVTGFRKEFANRIIAEIKLAVIKGNVAEIKALAGQQQGVRGVDSIADDSDAEDVAKALAKKFGCVVAVSGKTDIITDGEKSCLVLNGNEMLAGVTGTGCMATSLTASFCGVTSNYFVAAAAGITVMGIAGELAKQRLTVQQGLGTFRVGIFDAVSTMTSETILKMARIKG